MPPYPVLMHTVLDATDVRALAEFYRELLGLRYRPGDEPSTDEGADDADWLVLVDGDGNRKFAFQKVHTLARPTWPAHDVPQQLHLDFRVPTLDELERHRRRAEELGRRIPLNEHFHLNVDEDGDVRADHSLKVWNIPAVWLHYRMQRQA